MPSAFTTTHSNKSQSQPAAGKGCFVYRTNLYRRANWEGFVLYLPGQMSQYGYSSEELVSCCTYRTAW
jgi:hypothetical protein